MSQLVGYNLYYRTLHASGTLSAAAVGNSVNMKGLPFGINPVQLVLFLHRPGTEVSTATIIPQVEASFDDSSWFLLGAAETTVSATNTAGLHYVPDIGGALHYRVSITGTLDATNNYTTHSMYAVVATQGYRVNS